MEKFYDDVSGKLLPTPLVRAARLEEIKFSQSFPVYEKVPEDQARGKQKVSVRWCDVNKGDDREPQVRSRLVGREYKWQDPFMQGTFAATPPLESLRYMFHYMTTRRRRRGAPIKLKMLVMDVSRAHFHPPAVRELYINLPDEDSSPGKVGKLLRTLYGTRDAANQWDAFFNEKIAQLGYEVGMSSPCLYRHKERLSIGWRHGDDLIFIGEEAHMNELFEEISKLMIVKKRALLGFEAGDDHHVSILNRLVDCGMVNGVETISYEPDQRHADLIVAQLGLEESKARGVTTPGEKRGDYRDQEPLPRDLVTTYRSCTMRMAYLAADLPMLQFGANRLARGMSAPTMGHWNRLKRAARFLKAHPRWSQKFVMQETCSYVDVWTDSDWASDPVDRKSVSCIVVTIGSHCLKTQVATQTAPALSSGEAEFVANVKGGSISLGIQSMAKDLGDVLKARLRTDSSASKSISSRIGLGKVRHLDTALLWLQYHINRGQISIIKVKGTENNADIGTKDVEEAIMRRVLDELGFQELEGRHQKALSVANGLGGYDDQLEGPEEGGGD